MGGLSPARKLALKLVSARRRRAGRMRELLRSDEAAAALSPEDRALATRLALGTCSAEALLNALLDERVRKPASLEPRVRDALCIAAFEICYLSTPEAVAVSQGVELVRSVSPRASGMANAVLRRVAAELSPRIEEARANCQAGGASVDDIALAGGFSHELASTLFDECGQVHAAELALAQLCPAPIWLADLGAREAGELERLLEEEGLSPQPDALSGSYRLGKPVGLHKSEIVASACVAVADLAAQLVALVATPPPGTRMLEIGQGRATKTLLIEANAARLGGPVEIVGVDAVASKLPIARERIERAELSPHVSCLTWDGTKLDDPEAPEALRAQFDAIFIDAPCSGTGTMRRHPELPSRLSSGAADVVAGLHRLQLELLESAAQHVAQGGSLTYSTCSVLPQECEAVAYEFLAGSAGRAFEPEPISDAPGARFAPELIAGAETSEGYLRTWPGEDGWDGHFCARFVRRC